MLPTRFLGLQNNSIGAPGAMRLAQMCMAGSGKTTLYQLDLRRNDLGCEAVEAFLKGNPNQLTHISAIHGPTPCTVHHVPDSRVFFDGVAEGWWSAGSAGVVAGVA